MQLIITSHKCLDYLERGESLHRKVTLFDIRDLQM